MNTTLARIKELLNPKRKLTEDPHLLIPKKIIDGKAVADLGCGAGYYSRYIARYASRLYAIDSNAEMLSKAKTVVPGSNVEFIQADLSKIPLRNGIVSVVLLANVFHDVKSVGINVVEEVHRILKDNGIVIIIDWKKEEMDIGPPYNIRMSQSDYMEYFSTFKLVKEFPAGAYHYGMILKKT